jgi:protein involved in polysaccharide export with SLBB domain
VVIPVVGAVEVSGYTLAEGADAVRSAIARHYRHVSAQVGLAVLRVFSVPVTGQVHGPGIIQVTGVTRLTQALAQVGGVLPNGSLTRIVIAHRDGDTTLVDLGDFISDGELSANPPLILGDRVHVPLATDLVYVEGAVHVRGAYSLCRTEEGSWFESGQIVMEFIQGETASELVARAGGLTPWAVTDECQIFRQLPDGTEEIVYAGLDDPDVDPQLMPDDRLVVPGTSPTVAVTGHVAMPGVYPYVAMKDYLYYVGQAGGYGDRAATGSVRVILADGSRVDADEAGAVPAGAIVEVPEQSIKWWQDYLIILTGVASVVIAYKSIF